MAAYSLARAVTVANDILRFGGAILLDKAWDMCISLVEFASTVDDVKDNLESS